MEEIIPKEVESNEEAREIGEPSKLKDNIDNKVQRNATSPRKVNISKPQHVVDSPKRGPTLSTSTSSFEALDPHDPQLNQLASVMFSKTADWITGELASTSAEYELLEKMNRVTITKYSDMKQITENVSKGVIELNSRYQELVPYLDQIDQIDESVTRLEQAAYKLDAYSKRLEAKFKSLEKRNS
jgi:biogenesis of lysosome-related organelles complex 1 subunit 2